MSDKTNIVRLRTKIPQVDRPPPAPEDLADLAKALGVFEAAATAAEGPGDARVASLASLASMRPAPGTKSPLSVRRNERDAPGGAAIEPFVPPRPGPKNAP
jgi:hypothetical protein